MDNYAQLAIDASLNSEKIFCKFLSANDTGETGGHQSGIYIPKSSYSILFDKAGNKGENKEICAAIKWQDNITTQNHFKYYGQKTRNEYRITHFGRNFPFLKPEYTGALFILIKQNHEKYQGFVLNTEDEISQYLDTFGYSSTQTDSLIQHHLYIENENPENREKIEFDKFISNLKVPFPKSEDMSSAARNIYSTIYGHDKDIITNPDQLLINWITLEFKLFHAIEYARYNSMINTGFSSVDEFIATANQVLNRRKSRAGKSLEHHLSAIFNANNLTYDAQAKTEGNKKPDFLFPSQEAYHDKKFPVQKLITLAAKTTCKDRWRQIITEADRLKDEKKFLCTLQQGISSAQIKEMEENKVILVVPKPYIKNYPTSFQSQIWTLKKFIEYAKKIENS